MATIVTYTLMFTGVKTGAGVAGFGAHMAHEWVILANLLGLLLGFAILSKHFEESRIPAWLPKFLPDDWKGGFVLLVMIAFAIAAPVSFVFMSDWLENYDYRISINWWIFIVAGLLALVIALITVSSQAIRAAIRNPIKSLRTE